METAEEGGVKVKTEDVLSKETLDDEGDQVAMMLRIPLRELHSVTSPVRSGDSSVLRPEGSTVQACRSISAAAKLLPQHSKARLGSPTKVSLIPGKISLFATAKSFAKPPLAPCASVVGRVNPWKERESALSTVQDDDAGRGGARVYFASEATRDSSAPVRGSKLFSFSGMPGLGGVDMARKNMLGNAGDSSGPDSSLVTSLREEPEVISCARSSFLPSIFRRQKK